MLLRRKPPGMWEWEAAEMKALFRLTSGRVLVRRGYMGHTVRMHTYNEPKPESSFSVHDSGVSLRPSTAPGSSAERHSRRKPVPLSPTDIEYHTTTTTRIERSDPSCSEKPRFQTLQPTRPYSAVPDGPMFPKRSQTSLGYENTSTKQTSVVLATSKTSTPVPPRSPKRTQYMPHYQASPSQNAILTVAAPIRPAQMRPLRTAWKSLFGRRAGKGKISYSRNEAVIFARKTSLKRKKGKAVHSPYQPYSARVVTPSPVHNPKISRRESPFLSRQFSFKNSRGLNRKRKSGLPSFLSIDSSESLT
jgi:hypothetical protein